MRAPKQATSKRKGAIGDRPAAEPTDEAGVAVSFGVGADYGAGVGRGDGDGTGDGVGRGDGDGTGDGVGRGDGDGLGDGDGTGAGDGDGDGAEVFVGDTPLEVVAVVELGRWVDRAAAGMGATIVSTTGSAATATAVSDSRRMSDRRDRPTVSATGSVSPASASSAKAKRTMPSSAGSPERSATATTISSMLVAPSQRSKTTAADSFSACTSV